MATKIEWCDETINALKMRCTKISEGCQNCYALRILDRNLPGLSSYPKNGDRPILVESEAAKPMKWKKPKRIFWQSMGDLFHDDVTLLQQQQIFSYMKYAPQHTHIILTKRPGVMYAVMNEYFLKDGDSIPNNWWLGVTAENQRTADERIPILLGIPASVHFVSVEPMLERIDLDLCGSNYGRDDLNEMVNWVICGAETGTKSRYMETEWAMDLMHQCRSAKTPFFFKKWGDGSKVAGRDWQMNCGYGYQMPREFLGGIDA